MDWIVYILLLVLFILFLSGFAYLNKKIVRPIIINHIAQDASVAEDESQDESPVAPPPPQTTPIQITSKSSRPATPLAETSGTTPLSNLTAWRPRDLVVK